MKKILSTMTLLGVLCGAAHAAPYYTAVPQAGDLTPYDMQPVYTVDGLYSFGAGDHENLDMWGVRGSFNLYSSAATTFRHQFNLNIAPQWGSADSVDVFTMPVTAGYDLNIELADDILFYIGGKAGYAWWHEDAPRGDESEGGFTWSVGAGIKIQCSDDVYVRAGYEFGRTYIGGNVDDIYGAHTIVVGVGFTF